jgi:serine/threonine protein kinase
MEYMKHGDLLSNIAGPLPEDQAKTIVWQVLKGLKFMHDEGTVHRDLKPEVGAIILSATPPSSPRADN